MPSPIDQFSLKDRVILVTGASSGIGRQCAITISEMGGTVVLLGRDVGRLDETLSLMINPDKHLAFSLDLLEYDTVADVMGEIVNLKGRISGLINSAGISMTLPLNAVSPKKMEDLFKINVIGPINLTKHVVKTSHFSEAGGSIIFISSVMGVVGEVGKSIYSMTKGALIAVTRSLALEFAPRRIRVNAVSPGVVETPMSMQSAYSQNTDTLERIKSFHPLGLGNPTDISATCGFLLSDSSRWITGTNIISDGGYLAR